MGHIELSRSADLIIVAPATGDLMAKMALGMAPDLATTLLLATDAPVMIAPAMNVRMWEHAATKRNLETLRTDGIHVCGPDEGAMACGEFGFGRMTEPDAIADAASDILLNGPLKANISSLHLAQPTNRLTLCATSRTGHLDRKVPQSQTPCLCWVHGSALSLAPHVRTCPRDAISFAWKRHVKCWKQFKMLCRVTARFSPQLWPIGG